MIFCSYFFIYVVNIRRVETLPLARTWAHPFPCATFVRGSSSEWLIGSCNFDKRFLCTEEKHIIRTQARLVSRTIAAVSRETSTTLAQRNTELLFQTCLCWASLSIAQIAALKWCYVPAILSFAANVDTEYCTRSARSRVSRPRGTIMFFATVWTRANFQ